MKGKEGFVLYKDLVHTVNLLTDNQAGKLFKIVLKYVNDDKVTINNTTIKIAFEPIKHQLKRDLKHWESIKVKRSEAGAKGGKATQAIARSAKAKASKSSSNSYSKSNSNSNSNIKESKENKFSPPLLSEVKDYFLENGYSSQSASKAYNYYEVNNWKDSNNKKIVNWKQKMIAVWFKPENKVSETKSGYTLGSPIR